MATYTGICTVPSSTSSSNTPTESPRPDEFSPGAEGLDSAKSTERSRYIPSEIRERVLHQAGHRCELVGSDQPRCGARTGLQIPFSKDGSNDEINLGALCPTHNAWHAEREFGTEFMRSKIAASRMSSSPDHQPTGVREPRPRYHATPVSRDAVSRDAASCDAVSTDNGARQTRAHQPSGAPESRPDEVHATVKRTRPRPDEVNHS